MKVVIPSRGSKGKRDKVSDIFAKAPYFTIVKVERGKIMGVEVEENDASSMAQGAGPIAVKRFKDLGADVAITGDIGPGARTLIEISGLELFTVEPDIKISEAVHRYIESIAQKP